MALDLKEKIRPCIIDDGLDISRIEDSGFPPEVLEVAFQKLFDSPEHVHSALFAIRGELFAELYNEPWGPNTIHPLLSVSKTITALLLGAAIDRGVIESEKARVFDFFPEHTPNNDFKASITLENILTHTSGLEWHEIGIDYANPENSHFAMENSDDWPAFVLSRPLAHPPGEVFEYNTGAFHLFSVILERAFGSPMDKLAEQVLFQPLGIRESSWTRDPAGRPCSAGSGGGLSLTPRSLMKLGQTILAGGEFHGNRIVSKEWLSLSMRQIVTAPNGLGYGLGWWHSRIAGWECFTARGYAGQALAIVPALDFAAVFTGFDLAGTKFYDYTLYELLSSIRVKY